MNDDRFDLSADMRLLEHQRSAMGLTPVERPRWRTRLSASLAHVPVADEAPIVRRGAVVACTLHAHPGAALIAGAIVTITAVLHNDAPDTARDVRITLPLPATLSYRPGSLQVDGRDADARAPELFESALPLGDLAGDQRKTILFKAGIRAGTDPIHLTPAVTATGAAVVGARPLALTRAAAPSAFGRTLATEIPEAAATAPSVTAGPAAGDPELEDELPFYELDEEETIAAEALDAALSSAAPPREPPPAPVVPILEPPPAAPPLVVTTVREPAAAPPPIAVAPPVREFAVVVPVEPPPAAPAPVAAPPAPAAREGLVIATGGEPALLTSVAASKLGTMRQFFSPERSFGLTAHYLLLTVLATRTGDGNDATLADFFAAQERLLTRALISRKMGKNVALDDVAAPLPPFPIPVWNVAEIALPHSGDVVLYRGFKAGELDFLASAVGNAGTPAFVRAAQLAVGLAPQRSPDLAAGSRADELLVGYSTAAAAEINRLFVRARLDRKTNLFGPASPQLDDQARALLDVLAP